MTGVGLEVMTVTVITSNPKVMTGVGLEVMTGIGLRQLSVRGLGYDSWGWVRGLGLG